jgi:hypothetical protein
MMPAKKSAAAIVRVPRVLVAMISASSVAATRHHSDAGSACARLPQKVPRVRIGWWLDDGGEQPPQGSLGNRLVEGGMPDAGADRQFAFRRFQASQRRDTVDIDEMGGARQSECHDRHQALAAGEDAPVIRRHHGQRRDRFIERLWCVILEGGGLHRPISFRIWDYYYFLD